MYYNENNRTQRILQFDENQVAVYMTKVMGWMAVGLAVTFAIACSVYFTPEVANIILFNEFVFYGILIAEVAAVLIFRLVVERVSSITALIMFITYASLNGLTLSIVMVIYELSSIIYVLGVTVFIFFAMAAYGYITQKDMTKIGTMCLFGLFGIIIAGILNMFMRSESVDYIISFVGVILFVGLTAWDTQRIKNQYLYATSMGIDEKSDHIQKYAIMGALMLYLDFINLFLHLLRIMGRRKR